MLCKSIYVGADPTGTSYLSLFLPLGCTSYDNNSYIDNVNKADRMGLEKYTDGLQMDKFTTIKEISVYNNIYCVGLDGDLLFGSCDDDNTTEWFLIEYETFKYLGESHTTEGDKLIRYKTRQT